jgi:hypothetical protein
MDSTEDRFFSRGKLQPKQSFLILNFDVTASPSCFAFSNPYSCGYNHMQLIAGFEGLASSAYALKKAQQSVLMRK